MNVDRRCCAYAALVGCFTFAGVVGAAAQVYDIVDLGTLGGTSSRAYAINASDHVVGEALIASQQKHAFLWRPGHGMTDLGPGIARDINNAGLIVGEYDHQAVVWEDGVRTVLPTLVGTSHAARGVNNFGVVAGYSGNHAVLWMKIDGQWELVQDLDPVFPPHTGSRAYDINDAFEVTGSAYTGDFSFDLGDIWHAFRLSGGVAQDLGTLSYGSFGAAINATGHVTGSTTLLWCDFESRAFLWPGQPFMQDVSPFTEDCFYAYGKDLNNAGVVVGDGYGELFDYGYWDGPFVNSPARGVMIVDDELVPFAGHDARFADGINDAGHIAGAVADPWQNAAILVPHTADCNGNGRVDILDLIGPMYVVEQSGNGLYVAMPPLGEELELVGTLDAGVTHARGVAFNPVSGDLYAVVVIGGANHLATIDTDTAAVTDLGQLGGLFGGVIVDIAFGPDGTLYGTQEDPTFNIFSGHVSQIDPQNPGAPTTVAAGSAGLWQSIAVDPVTGLIYQTGNGTLVTIDPVSHLVTPISGGVNLDIGGLTFHPTTGDLLAYLESGDIYRIDLTTGAYEQFNHADHARTPDGVAFAPSSTDLNGDLVPDECTPGDWNGDGAPDAEDLTRALDCVTGPQVAIFPGCELFDENHDGDVDLHDVARLTATP